MSKALHPKHVNALLETAPYPEERQLVLEMITAGATVNPGYTFGSTFVASRWVREKTAEWIRLGFDIGRAVSPEGQELITLVRRASAPSIDLLETIDTEGNGF